MAFVEHVLPNPMRGTFDVAAVEAFVELGDDGEEVADEGF